MYLKKYIKYFFLALVLVFPSISFSAFDVPPDYLSVFYNTGSGTTYSFGKSGSTDALTRQWFYKPEASHNICSVTVGLTASGDPVDSVQLKSYFANDFVSGTSVDFDTYDGSSLSGLSPGSGLFLGSAVSSFQVRATSSVEYVEFVFSPCLVVIGSNGYWFELSRTGVVDSSNYYNVQGFVSGSGGSYAFLGAEDSNNWFVQFSRNNGNEDTSSSFTMWSVALNGTENFSAYDPVLTYASTSEISGSCENAGILRALCYLILPAPQVLGDGINALYDYFITIPPFTIFASVSSIFGNWTSGFNSATASSSMLYLPYSQLGASSSVSVSLTSIASYPPVSFLRTVLGYFVYVAIFFIVIRAVGRLV